MISKRWYKQSPPVPRCRPTHFVAGLGCFVAPFFACFVACMGVLSCTPGQSSGNLGSDSLGAGSSPDVPRCPGGKAGEFLNRTFEVQADGETYPEDTLTELNNPDSLDCGATLSVMVTRTDDQSHNVLAVKNLRVTHTSQFDVPANHTLQHIRASTGYTSQNQPLTASVNLRVTGDPGLPQATASLTLQSDDPERVDSDRIDLSTEARDDLKIALCKRDRAMPVTLSVSYTFEITASSGQGSGNRQTSVSGSGNTRSAQPQNAGQDQDSANRGFAFDSLDLRLDVAECAPEEP